jgi:disulfide oxidoreductase YuzD
MKEKQYLISEEDLDKLIETPASLNTYEWVADIKSKQPVSTLDRDRVLNEMKELISKYMTTLDGDMADEDMEYVVMEEFATPNKLAEDLADAICSLAVQPVDRDRVGDVLEEWFDTPNKADKILYSFKKEIIDQICNLAVPEGEVVAEGKVKIKDKVPCWYVGDSEVLNLIRGVVHKYEGKTIQIIIREVGN